MLKKFASRFVPQDANNMSGRSVLYLLDTNIASVLLDGSDVRLKKRLEATPQDSALSIITWGELWYGARNSSRIGRNLLRLDELTRIYELIPCNKGTAEHYGVIKHKLRTQGVIIPENDIWIAATAIQHNLILVTRDKDFDPVEGLQREAW